MKIKSSLAALAAMSLAASPALAATANPAASLSVAKTVRAGSTTGKSSELAGAGILAAIIGAGIVAIGVIAIVNDSNDDDSDSN